MGAVAVGRQLNRDNQASKAARRKWQIPDPPRPIKDTTRTRYNAIRHGILARSVVLQDEDPQMYEDLRTALGMDLGVVGMVEEMWLDQLASCYWRLQRILRAEADPKANLDLLHRYEVGLRNEMKGIIAEIREAQRIRQNGYINAKISPDHRRDYAEAAVEHEKGFWGSVQEDFDGPQPAPETVAAETASAPEPEQNAAAPESPTHCETNSRPEYIQGGGRVAPPMVRAYVGDREGLMSRREGV